MIDKSNIETTDWLIKGISSEKLAKEKAKAIKQADKELARIEKKEQKQEMRAYRKMYRRHRKELVKHAKVTREWDWGWLHDSIIMQIRHMHEYYTARNNVWQTDETLIPIIQSLKYILNLQEEIDNLWDDDTLSWEEEENREQELYESIYHSIGDNLQLWWD